jgi:hypothetical protein
MSEQILELLLSIAGATAGVLYAYFGDKWQTPFFRNRSRWRYLAAITIGAMLSYGVARLFISPWLFPARAVGAATINAPLEGEKVPHGASVQGRVFGIAEGESVWLLVIPSESPYYHPQPGPLAVARDGNWFGVAYVGAPSMADNGKAFTILVVLAGQKGSAVFRAYLASTQRTNNYPGMGELPPDVYPLAQIRVQRQ